MTNFDLHERAQQLADNESAYQLARRLIEMEQDRDQLRGCFHNACEELAALKAALVDEGEEVPTGPALSLVERLKARLAKAEQRVEREATGFRAMCEAFQRLEEIVGMDTGGWNGPAPALNAVESIVQRRDALAAYAEDLRKAGNRAICYGGAESPDDWHRVLTQAPEVSLALRDAGERAKGASAIRHLTQGEGWEDQDLRKVIDDYIATVVQVSQATKETLDGD
ncbi:hypothetical protein [Halomonas salipaludis]|uniref:Uncharacterized protein n=1 Tax=Halomonas salipaludis TaxID=2032625 RepID=A0A2A2F3K2_9GAMM|nr:hypothetical protein [Halomonas salipaludis]PAU79175.1 hypothetical protein CK498_02065 [Halomonas salipaludis]